MPTRRRVLRHASAFALPLALRGHAGDSVTGVALSERCAEVIRGWDMIPDHRTGTDGDRAAARWLANEIARRGATPQLDEFPFVRRVLHECSVSAGGLRAEGVPCFDGTFTTPDGLRAPLAPLAEKRSIGLARYSLTEPLPSNEALVAARRTGAFAAIVAIAASSKSPPGITPVNADAYLAPYGPPVLQVSAEHTTWLEAAASTGSEARFVAHGTVENTTTCNVETRIEGRDPTLPPVVIMTPRSGWWVCTSERGGGMAVWLETLRHFVVNRPERTVLFTANTGHELGHLGLDAFLARQPTLLATAHVWIHLGANFAATGGAVRYQASNDALMARGLELLTRHGQKPASTTPVGTRPLGEARNVFDGGGRFVSLLGQNPLFHHPNDRWPHAVDVPKTAALCAAMVEFADQLSGV